MAFSWRRKSTTRALPPAAQSAQPDWVSSMQEHFRANGYYRAEDLARVLGDPRETVQISAGSDFQLAARNER
jgi:hypothetical protein